MSWREAFDSYVGELVQVRDALQEAQIMRNVYYKEIEALTRFIQFIEFNPPETINTQSDEIGDLRGRISRASSILLGVDSLPESEGFPLDAQKCYNDYQDQPSEFTHTHPNGEECPECGKRYGFKKSEPYLLTMMERVSDDRKEGYKKVMVGFINYSCICGNYIFRATTDDPPMIVENTDDHDVK